MPLPLGRLQLEKFTYIFCVPVYVRKTCDFLLAIRERERERERASERASERESARERERERRTSIDVFTYDAQVNDNTPRRQPDDAEAFKRQARGSA